MNTLIKPNKVFATNNCELEEGPAEGYCDGYCHSRCADYCDTNTTAIEEDILF